MDVVLGGQAAKTITSLGITPPCKMEDIVNTMPWGGRMALSITPEEVTDGVGGDVYIFKAPSGGTKHKTHIVARVTARADTSLVGKLLFGYLKMDDSNDNNSPLTCEWYKPTLTAT